MNQRLWEGAIESEGIVVRLDRELRTALRGEPDTDPFAGQHKVGRSGDAPQFRHEGGSGQAGGQQAVQRQRPLAQHTKVAAADCMNPRAVKKPVPSACRSNIPRQLKPA